MCPSTPTGTATSVYLASAPDLAPVTGCYFVNNKPKRSAERTYNETAAARLWQVSAGLVGLGHYQTAKSGDCSS
jgi:retinol dehydrogenase-14